MRRWIEVSAWIAGSALLAAYAAIQAWSAYASHAGIATLRQAAQSVNHAGSLASPAARTRLSFVTEEVTLPTPSDPDFSSWSTGRIAAYLRAAESREAPEAVLRIPSLILEVPVYAGVSEWNMNRGAAWIEGTAPAGSTGNVGIAAHRDGFFRPLKDTRVGDPLYLDTVQGQTMYRVTQISIVSPDAVDVLDDTSQPSVTLVTCYPFYHLGAAPMRFVVRAEIVAAVGAFPVSRDAAGAVDTMTRR